MQQAGAIPLQSTLRCQHLPASSVVCCKHLRGLYENTCLQVPGPEYILGLGCKPPPSSSLCGLQDRESRSAIVRCYYSHRLFMGFCCICCEVLYLALYLAHWPGIWSLPHWRLPWQSPFDLQLLGDARLCLPIERTRLCIVLLCLPTACISLEQHIKLSSISAQQASCR